MAVHGTQLLLMLACIIVMGESLTCNDITCCPGTICMEELRGSSEVIAVRCVTPTSCDQLECPSGFTCVNETEQDESNGGGGVSCQASCSGVQCPNFLQCVEEGSTTECVVPDNCSLIECPIGTECQILEDEDMIAAVCLGQTCDTVQCFRGTECFATNTDSLGNLINILNGPPSRVARDSSRSDGNGGEGGASGVGSASGGGSETGSSTGSETGSSTGSETGSSIGSGAGSTSGPQGRDVATCFPSCDGPNVCPQGFVCESDVFKLTCREAGSCFDLQCPPGQECQEVPCGTRRARRSSSGTKPTPGTTSGVMVQCVGSPGSTPSEASPPLERIGNDGAASIINGAGSFAMSKPGMFASAAAGLVLSICALFVLSL